MFSQKITPFQAEQDIQYRKMGGVYEERVSDAMPRLQFFSPWDVIIDAPQGHATDGYGNLKDDKPPIWREFPRQCQYEPAQRQQQRE